MDKYSPSRDRFLNDVRLHKMHIELDAGVHRSVLFSRPDSSVYRFRLVTWPGYLAISGDCEDYIFTRLPDMFDFFRSDYDREAPINPGYWGEKLGAVGKNGGYKDYSEEAYEKAIRNDLLCHVEDRPFSERRAILESARLDDLLVAPQDIHSAIDRATSWYCPLARDYPFPDFWDHNLTDYTFQFIWAIRAIAWGVRKYDLHKAGRTQEAHDKAVLAGDV